MARDLIAMGIGGWVGTALVIGYFYVQNVHFDLKTVAVACLLPFTVGICTEVVYYLVRMNTFLLGTMLLPEVVVLTTTLMGIATIAYVIYKERCGVRFLDVREELRADTEEGESDENEDYDDNENDGEHEDEDEDEKDSEHESEKEGENEDEHQDKDEHDDDNNHENGGDSDNEPEDTNDTTESESDEEEEVCIVTPPPAHDSRDIIAELGFAALPPLPS